MAWEGRDERSSMEVLDWEWLFFDYAHHGLWSINIVELEGREKKKEQTEAKWVSTLVIRSPYLPPNHHIFLRCPTISA